MPRKKKTTRKKITRRQPVEETPMEAPEEAPKKTRRKKTTRKKATRKKKTQRKPVQREPVSDEAPVPVEVKTVNAPDSDESFQILEVEVRGTVYHRLQKLCNGEDSVEEVAARMIEQGLNAAQAQAEQLTPAAELTAAEEDPEFLEAHQRWLRGE